MKRTTFEDILSPRLRDRLDRVRREHEERGCGVFGAGCECTCEDHPCAGVFDDGECVTCRGATVVQRGAYVRGEMVRIIPCPDCDGGERVIAPDLPWEWAGAANLATLAPTIRPAVTTWTATAGVPFLVFYGATGRGKTWAAVAAARSLAQAGIRVRYATMSGLLNDLQAQIGRDASEREDVLGAVRGVQCLVLDDFGRERRSDWTVAQVFDLVNYRYERRATTIVTTNLDPYRADDALWGRLCDRSLSFVVRVDGIDRRRQS